MPKTLYFFLLTFILITTGCATPSVNEQLINVSNLGWTSAARMYLEKGADVNSCNKEGTTPLMAASAGGDLATVQLVLDYRANVYRSDIKGRTALFYAATAGNGEIVKTLLSFGALPNARDNKGFTPLLGALVYKKLQTGHILIDAGADVNIATKYGYTPLHCAAHHGYTAILRRLITKGADVNARELFDLQTPLMYALDKNKTETVRLLLDAGADINAKDDNSCTALMHADGKKKIEQILLSAGATPYRKEDKCQDSPYRMIQRLYGSKGALDEQDRTLKDFEKFLAKNTSKKGGRLSSSQEKYMKAMYFFANEKYEKAKNYLDEFLSNNPDVATAYRDRGNVYWRLGKAEQAINDLSKALELDPSDAWTYTYRCSTYGAMGNYEKALSDCNKAIEIDPSIAAAYIDRCRIHHHFGKIDRGLEDCNKAIAIEPEDYAPYRNRAKIYLQQEDFENALLDYNKIIELKADDAVVYFERAEIYIKLDQYQEAYNDFVTAIKKKPDYAPAYNNKAWLLATCPEAKLRNGQEAVQDALKALELAPNDSGYMDTLAAAYAEDDQFEKAISIQKMVIKQLKEQNAPQPFFNECNERLESYESNISGREPFNRKAPENHEIKKPASLKRKASVQTQQSSDTRDPKLEKFRLKFNEALAAYENKAYERAFSYWLYLAENGHPESAFRIADMYDFAQGVPQDYKQAARWYLAAVMRGHGEAQCRIASRYDGGPGIPRNRSEAYRWSWLCAQNKGASESAKYYAGITLRTYFSVGVLSPEQIESLEEQAQRWEPVPSLDF